MNRKTSTLDKLYRPSLRKQLEAGVDDVQSDVAALAKQLDRFDAQIEAIKSDLETLVEAGARRESEPAPRVTAFGPVGSVGARMTSAEIAKLVQN